MARYYWRLVQINRNPKGWVALAATFKEIGPGESVSGNAIDSILEVGTYLVASAYLNCFKRLWRSVFVEPPLEVS